VRQAVGPWVAEPAIGITLLFYFPSYMRRCGCKSRGRQEWNASAQLARLVTTAAHTGIRRLYKA